VSGSPSAENFLAREKALLGDDADQFTSSNDAVAFDDLLGGGGEGAITEFDSQFPDISNTSQVWKAVDDLLNFWLTFVCLGYYPRQQYHSALYQLQLRLRRVHGGRNGA
jgi:hypothetical protein